MLLQVQNPILESVNDERQVTETFKKYGIIPYYGNWESSSHEMLNVLKDLCELSPSHGSCVDDKAGYAFGGGLDFTVRQTPGVAYKKAGEVSISQKENFESQLLDMGLAPIPLKDTLETLYGYEQESGNAYLHIKVLKLNRAKKVILQPVWYPEVAYLKSRARNEKVLVQTERWDENYWREKKPLLIKASYIGQPFNWQKCTDGVETMLHLRVPKGSKFYGRPRIINSLFWMFVEVMASHQAVKIGRTDYVGQKILAFEEVPTERVKGGKDNKETGFKTKIDALRQIITVEGEDAKVLAGVKYPVGGKAPTAIDLTYNRDSEYKRLIMDTAASQVYASHHWDKQLGGLNTVGANNGGDVYWSLLETKNMSVIKPTQNRWEWVLNYCLDEIWKVYGMGLPLHTQLDPILDKTLKERNAKEKGNAKNTNDSKPSNPV